MIGAVRDVFKQTTIPYRTDVDTRTLSTFRIGGVCPLVIEPQCENELIEAIRICRLVGVRFAVIGRGSNLLFADGELKHVLIRAAALDALRPTQVGISAQAGCSLARLAHFAADRELSGLAFAAGIPGTLGGALVMNAGAYGKEIGTLVQSVTVLDICQARVTVLSREELCFSYRSSLLQARDLTVLSAELALPVRASRAAILAEMAELAKRRRESQPLQQPSAGSVFRRPASGEPMGKVIEELGLKGLRCGNAAVSDKHAGFIVNLGGATAADVLTLIEHIRKNVERERGFLPIPEIRYVP
ncbi:MAG: UDP-N-acetylmuramate dehydrogenase [Clostridia bacterium]|nr:UDP-N-acetylmuramate dehydrogenase [Clostridia bacterium]